MDVLSPTGGNVWKIVVKEGEKVSIGQELMILESMKMEIPVEAEAEGTVALQVAEGDKILEDQVLARIT